jgi:hypothetical protein
MTPRAIGRRRSWANRHTSKKALLSFGDLKATSGSNLTFPFRIFPCVRVWCMRTGISLTVSRSDRRRLGPRGVMHSFADGRIEDTGPLTKKRMETFDEEVNANS